MIFCGLGFDPFLLSHEFEHFLLNSLLHFRLLVFSLSFLLFFHIAHKLSELWMELISFLLLLHRSSEISRLFVQVKEAFSLVTVIRGIGSRWRHSRIRVLVIFRLNVEIECLPIRFLAILRILDTFCSLVFRLLLSFVPFLNHVIHKFVSFISFYIIF